MTEKRFLTGLLGRDIQLSRSPRMHEHEADAQGIRLVYSLFDFSILGYAERDLPRMLDALELAGFAGVNVTHPFKQAIIPELDEVTDEAERIGAVNTVVFRGGRRIGYNTDVSGFAAGFRQCLDGVSLDDVVQIGAGGGGSATAYALLSLGARRLTIYDRDALRAEALAERLVKYFGPGKVAPGAELGQSLSACDGIVNATPMGMAAYPGMPVPEGAVTKARWVAEIVYFPLETALLATARAAGCRVMDGSGMAVHQAAGAFEIFTGIAADTYRMECTFIACDAEPYANFHV